MEAAAVAMWTFLNEVPIPDDVSQLLVQGEQAVAAFKTFRDSAVFTTKRLIVRDAQGITGKKVEVYSLPYSSINMWSSENAGRILDPNAELELWTRAGLIKIKLGKGADIRRIDSLIGWADGAYVLVAVGLAFVTTRDFIGMGRYVLAAVPSFAALADVLLRWSAGAMVGLRRWLPSLVLGVNGVLLAWMVSLFARWYFLS